MLKDCQHLETRTEGDSSIDNVSVQVRLQASSRSIRVAQERRRKLSPTIEQLEMQVAPLRTIEVAMANATTLHGITSEHAKGQLFP
jgi:hypothetical protein